LCEVKKGNHEVRRNKGHTLLTVCLNFSVAEPGIVLGAVAERDGASGWWEVMATTGAGALSSSEVMDLPLEFKEFERGINGWW
jgi:hypothetical protein